MVAGLSVVSVGRFANGAVGMAADAREDEAGMADILKECLMAEGYKYKLVGPWRERQWIMDKLIRFALWVGGISLVRQVDG